MRMPLVPALPLAQDVVAVGGVLLAGPERDVAARGADGVEADGVARALHADHLALAVAVDQQVVFDHVEGLVGVGDGAAAAQRDALAPVAAAVGEVVQMVVIDPVRSDMPVGG
jgi:hypothetical protein